MGELLSHSPKPLVESKGELIFLDGQYLLHWFDEGQEHFKLVSPAALRSAFCHEPVESGWLSENVIRWGISSDGSWAVKFIPRASYKLDFGENQSLTVPLPGMVFLGVNRQYYVWALERDKFHPKAKAFHAPLPNVYPQGLVCFGNNIPPTANGQSIGQAWQLFIESQFNNHLSNGKSMRSPDDVRLQLGAVAAAKLLDYL